MHEVESNANFILEEQDASVGNAPAFVLVTQAPSSPPVTNKNFAEEDVPDETARRSVMGEGVEFTGPIDPQALCVACEPLARRRTAHRWICRPWDFHRPHDTEWWLVPSPDWPAYSHGKFSYRRFRAARESVLAGLYVEKGPTSRVSAAFSSPRARQLVMTPNWQWFRFRDSATTGELDTVLDALSTRLRRPLEIFLQVSLANDPKSFDPYGLDLPRENHGFTFTGGALSPPKTVSASSLLPQVSGATSLAQLVGTIEANDFFDWLWVDFVVALQLHPAFSPAAHTWGVEQLWDRFFVDLVPWTGDLS